MKIIKIYNIIDKLLLKRYNLVNYRDDNDFAHKKAEEELDAIQPKDIRNKMYANFLKVREKGLEVLLLNHIKEIKTNLDTTIKLLQITISKYRLHVIYDNNLTKIIHVFKKSKQKEQTKVNISIERIKNIIK